jgi:hypothetical protein
VSNTITINGQEHSLERLRTEAQEGIEAFQGKELEMAFTIYGPEYVASAMRGMMRTIEALVDEVDRVRDLYLNANESA